MALSVTDRGHVTNTAGSAGDAVTTITSGSFTPAAGSLLVAIVGAYEFGTLTLSASSTIATGGWTQVSGSVSALGYGIRSSIFYAVCTSTPGTGTVTVTRTSGATTDNWLDLTVIEFGGHAGVRQTAQGNNAAASLTVNLPGARAGGSALVSGAVTALDTTITTPTGWTLLYHTVNAPNNNFAAASARHPSPSADSVTWAGLETTANTAALIEVAAAPDPAAGTFTVYDHVHVSVTGTAPSVPPAAGQFTAYDHTHVAATGTAPGIPPAAGSFAVIDGTTVAVVGGRASQGQFVNEYLVDGNGDPIVDGNGDPIVASYGAVTDETLVAWVGDAPDVDTAEGQFTAVDETTVTATGGRDSTGSGSVFDTATAVATGARNSETAATVLDAATAAWVGDAPEVEAAEGQFTAVDEATVAGAGSRASAGSATAEATDTAVAAGARDSAGTVTAEATDQAAATGARDSTGSATAEDYTRVYWSSSTVPEGQFAAVDQTSVTGAGARDSEGTAAVTDTATATWTGSAPVVGGASGTFTAYDHTTAAATGARSSTGTASAEATDTVSTTGARDSEGTATTVDNTHVQWVGQADELAIPTGQFVMYDHVHVDPAGERASTGTATVHDHCHLAATGARQSRGYCTAHDTTTVRWSAPTTLPDLRERHTGRRPDTTTSGRRPEHELSGRRSST